MACNRKKQVVYRFTNEFVNTNSTRCETAYFTVCFQCAISGACMKLKFIKCDMHIKRNWMRCLVVHVCACLNDVYWHIITELWLGDLVVRTECNVSQVARIVIAVYIHLANVLTIWTHSNSTQTSTLNCILTHGAWCTFIHRCSCCCFSHLKSDKCQKYTIAHMKIILCKNVLRSFLFAHCVSYNYISKYYD